MKRSKFVSLLPTILCVAAVSFTSCGGSDDDSVTDVTVTEQPISAPTGLSATPSGTSIIVTWNAVARAISYEVYRSADGSKFNLLGKTNATSYTDASPLTGNNYYAVKAIGANSSSEQSLSTLPVGDPNRIVVTVNGESFTMIKVKGGTFQMGSDAGKNDEKPVHNVTLSDYAIGETEVTQELWLAVMGYNPSCFIGANLPVEGVSDEECVTFILRLNEMTGKIFRLPTEAEWEYAAKGGHKNNGVVYVYSGSNTIDNVAWYGNNSGKRTHPVGEKQANQLGLYDMSGNVWERCQDYYDYYSNSPQNNPTGPSSGICRVCRGGKYDCPADDCRTTKREWDYPDYMVLADVGLRLAL